MKPYTKEIIEYRLICYGCYAESDKIILARKTITNNQHLPRPAGWIVLDTVALCPECAKRFDTR